MLKIASTYILIYIIIHCYHPHPVGLGRVASLLLSKTECLVYRVIYAGGPCTALGQLLLADTLTYTQFRFFLEI